MYFDDSEYDFPQIAHRMSPMMQGSVLDEDGKGGYRFDRLAFKDPFDILGYMSGPIIAKSQQKREERHSRVGILPEPVSPIGIVL